MKKAILGIFLAAALTGCAGEARPLSDQKPAGAEPVQAPALETRQPESAPEIAESEGKNPESGLVLVNKTAPLSAEYAPSDLVEPRVPFPFSGASERKLMRKEAAEALEKLFAEAKKAGLHLYAMSGYRSYARQEQIFGENAKDKGEEEANKLSAKPGQSEHQTGLAMDVTAPSEKYKLEESFAATKEGKWLAENARDYGFIIRYPKGKEDITGYAYEPWHIRFVGVEAAKEIEASGLTLEEYEQSKRRE